MSTINSFLQLDSSQYAQAPIGATRVATKGNGTNLYGTIPDWTATNWEIEFDVQFPTTAMNDKKILDGDVTGVNKVDFAVISGGKMSYNAAVVSSGTIDGVAFTSTVTAHPLDGAVHHIKLVGNTAVSVGTLLTRYSRDQKWSSAILFNLRLTDLDTPANSRFYPMNGDGSSAVITDTSANAQHGTWYNRTSGDVVTVYPDAIKPGQEFWFAFKYKVTDVSQNGGYNYLLSLGTKASAKSMYSVYLPESNGQFGIDQYNNTVRAVVHYGKDFGATHLDGDEHTAVVHVKTDGSFDYWVDSTSPTYSSGTAAIAYAIDNLNLGGYRSGSDAATAKMGANIHYAYLYSALSAGDITALMQGANPESVGTIRQGYDLNGNGNEKNGGNPLVLYGNPSFVVSGSPRKSKHNTVESIVCGIAYVV